MKISIRRGMSYFARATYLPRTCDVPATFPWRIRDVSVFVWNFTFVCTAYQGVCYVRVTYAWRTKCTRDVSTAIWYVLNSNLICGVSVLYQWLFNTCTYENKRLCLLCSCHSHITVILNYQRSKIHRRNLDNLD